MITKNIFFKKALLFKRNNCYTGAFSYSDVVNSQLPFSEFLKQNTSFHENNFPTLTENHHFFNSEKKNLNFLPQQIKIYFFCH